MTEVSIKEQLTDTENEMDTVFGAAMFTFTASSEKLNTHPVMLFYIGLNTPEPGGMTYLADLEFLHSVKAMEHAKNYSREIGSMGNKFIPYNITSQSTLLEIRYVFFIPFYTIHYYLIKLHSNYYRNYNKKKEPYNKTPSITHITINLKSYNKHHLQHTHTQQLLL